MLGQIQGLGFRLQEEIMLRTLTMDVIKSSEIEGELLNSEQVRSSIARRLGIQIAGAVPAERNVEGIVKMMLDATQKYRTPLTADRLYDWHATLFPTGRSGMFRINVGAWRDGAMQVTSGPMGKEIVHFDAPDTEKLPQEMKHLLDWMANASDIDPVLKAAIAHLWFVTVHPFDDSNGRIARAIADLQLARADESPQRFYSMSAQIQAERNAYYDILENTQKGDLDITLWLEWFLDTLMCSMEQTDQTISKTLARAKFWETHRNTDFNARQQKVLGLLLDDFFGKLNVSKYTKITKTSADTALRDLKDLIGKDVMEQLGGGRSTIYQLKTHSGEK